MDRILIYFLYFLLILVSIIDIKRKYIPNFLNLIIFFICIFLRSINNFDVFIISSGVFTLPIILVYGYGSDLLKKEIFGFGDIKLIMSLGGILLNETINIFLQIYIFYLTAFSTASIFILFVYIYKRLRGKKILFRNQELAFAPFISFAFFLVYNFDYFRGILYE